MRLLRMTPDLVTILLPNGLLKELPDHKDKRYDKIVIEPCSTYRTYYLGAVICQTTVTWPVTPQCHLVPSPPLARPSALSAGGGQWSI